MGQRRLEHLSLAFGSLPEPQGVGMFLVVDRIGVDRVDRVDGVDRVGIWCWNLMLTWVVPLRSMILIQCRHWGCGLGPNLSIGIPLFAMAALKKWRIMPKAPISQTIELPEAPRFFGSSIPVESEKIHGNPPTFHLGPSQTPQNHHLMLHLICQGFDTWWFLL